MSTLWGENIRKRREALGMTKAELARHVGVSGATVSDWESGVIKKIDGHNLVTAAHVLRTSAEQLVGTDDCLVTETQSNTSNLPLIQVGKVPVVGSIEVSQTGSHRLTSAPPPYRQLLHPSADRAAFAWLVADDSLRPRFKPGEFLVIEPTSPPEWGFECAARTLDGQVLIKTLDWRRGGLTQFSGINDDGRPTTVRDDALEFVLRIAALAPASRLIP